MPDAAATALPAKEAATRREATRDAIASARIEGMSVSADAQAIMDRRDEGKIDGEELIAAVRRLHAGS